MKQQPTLNGLAAAELLNSSGQEQKTSSKVADPVEKNKEVFPRPSLIPNVSYPTSKREEQIISLTWDHAMQYSRMQYEFYDPILDIFRERVQEIRKKLIQTGKIKPVTKEERKWRMGL